MFQLLICFAASLTGVEPDPGGDVNPPQAWEQFAEEAADAPGASRLELPADERDGDDPTRGWRAGWLRVEGGGMTAWRSGRRSRTGDIGFRVLLDYEIPVVNHLTISPRAMPFMFWNENGEGDNDIYIAGLGVALRAYVKKTEYRGFYAEVGLMGIAQTDKFEGNSGAFNFLEEIGVGYQFKSDWSASLKVGHISNAGLANDNAGVNWATLGVGYRFGR